MRISVCVITRDEESSLPRCLTSCAPVADEIIVLDSGSTDRTLEIARNFGAKALFQEWLGYVGQKNRILELATHEWVLSLDADEELSTALLGEIQALKRESISAEVSGFSMPRCVLYEGRWIRHGDWYPDRLTRLFRRKKAHFAGGKVHERLEIAGGIRPLYGDLNHYSFRDAADHRERARKYARLWAESQSEQGKSSWPFEGYVHAAHKLIRGFILRLGFLDGAQGWRIARINAREVVWKYEFLRDLSRR